MAVKQENPVLLTHLETFQVLHQEEQQLLQKHLPQTTLASIAITLQITENATMKKELVKNANSTIIKHQCAILASIVLALNACSPIQEIQAALEMEMVIF